MTRRLLLVLYLSLKVLVRIVLALYYPRTAVAGRRHLRLRGPTLLTTNHPNTLLDALNAASRVDQQVFFLVNAGLFRVPWQARLLSALYCIPIERPQDTAGRPVNNEETFARCDAHLSGGGHIYIAPEGSSYLERRLRPLKSGTARIAFSAEGKHDFRLGVRILPIGLNYERANRFGAELFVRVGEPILVADYQERYEENPREAVAALTQALEERLRALVVDTRDEAEDAFVRRLETLLRNSAPTGAPAHFARVKRLIAGYRHWVLEAPGEAEHFWKQTHAYGDRLRALGAADHALTETPTTRRRRQAALLAGWPLFAYGALNNFLPYQMPRLLVRRLGLYIGYEATVKVLSGLLTFPMFYFLQFRLAAWALPAPAAWAYLFSLPLTGWGAWRYAQAWKKERAARHWHGWRDRNAAAAADIVAQRMSLWATLEWLLAENPSGNFFRKGS
jgi:glycerol-3-phosphate O-acyltransferase/dihydroxyacetone phosphate acyltransferase